MKHSPPAIRLGSQLTTIAAMCALTAGCGGGGAAAAQDTSHAAADAGEATIQAPPASAAAPAVTQGPTVTSTSPASDATDAAIDAVIAATFSQTLNPATVDPTTFQVVDARNRPVRGTVRHSGTSVTFTPSEALAPAETYTVTIATGVQDTAGNALAATYSWKFQTGLTTYELTAIGEDPAGDTEELFTLVNDLNERGEVIGEAVHTQNLDRQEPTQESLAFLWRDGRLIDLGALSDPVRDSRSQGVNDHGEVVGWSYPGAGGHPAFHWEQDEMRTIGLEDALAINNEGQVVGFIARTQGNEASGVAVIWQADQLVELEGLIQPWNINDAGDVVGFTYVSQRPQAALWQAGNVTALGVLPAARASQAFDINSERQIVGTSQFAAPDGSANYERAFLWHSGQMIELPLLDDSHSSSGASGINDLGHVVGRSGAAQSSATVWFGEKPYDLNELIAENDPLKPYVTLLEAREINNRGQIIAQGTDSRRPGSYTGFLLTPRSRQ